jgi:hypothetical protein
MPKETEGIFLAENEGRSEEAHTAGYLTGAVILAF